MKRTISIERLGGYVLHTVVDKDDDYDHTYWMGYCAGAALGIGENVRVIVREDNAITDIFECYPPKETP